MFTNNSKRSQYLKNLFVFITIVTFLGIPSGIGHAAPASFFDTDLTRGRDRFIEVVNIATDNNAVFYERAFSSDPGSVFSVTGDDSSTVWVRATKNDASVAFNYYTSGAYYHGWSVSVSSWNEVVNEGIKFEFFEDSGLTTALEINAFGVQTQDWGTCCLGPNYTPTGTAAGTGSPPHPRSPGSPSRRRTSPGSPPGR